MINSHYLNIYRVFIYIILLFSQCVVKATFPNILLNINLVLSDENIDKLSINNWLKKENDNFFKTIFRKNSTGLVVSIEVILFFHTNKNNEFSMYFFVTNRFSFFLYSLNSFTKLANVLICILYIYYFKS